MKIIVEESALDSIKLMATRLQNERDMLLQVLDNVLLRWEEYASDPTGSNAIEANASVLQARKQLDECKQTGKLWA